MITHDLISYLEDFEADHGDSKKIVLVTPEGNFEATRTEIGWDANDKKVFRIVAE